MNLIDAYIYEVTRRLPEKSRDDIGLELRSTIEDMLPHEYTEEDVKYVLEQLGNPAILASGYSEKPMHLIGPKYFDVYVSLLKMVLPIAAVISIISLVADYVIGNSNEAILNAFLNLLGLGIWRIIDVTMQVFFWLTVVFAVIERVDGHNDRIPRTMNMTKWTPDDLKYVVNISKEKSISKIEVFGSLLWTAIWGTVYFYANRIIGVYNKTEEGLLFVHPALNQDVLNSYWLLIIVVIAIEVAFALYKLLKKQWSKRMAIYNTLYQLIATVILMIIMMNPNLFTAEYLLNMSNIFGISPKQFEGRFILGIILIFFISAVWNSYYGFKLAKKR